MGKLFAIEGTDGSGKQTQFTKLCERLKKDGISIFKVDKQKGSVEKIGFVKSGIHPRNFNITPNGKYLLCACRDSNFIEIFEINPEYGNLLKINKEIRIEKPVCIKFL